MPKRAITRAQARRQRIDAERQANRPGVTQAQWDAIPPS
jgi:hypothetical protein